MEDDVKKAESSIDMARFIRSQVEWEEDSLCPQLSLFPEVFPPPEKGVKPEYPKDRNEEAGHQNESSVEDWVSFWIIMGRMSNPLHEVGIGPCVALTTGLH